MFSSFRLSPCGRRWQVNYNFSVFKVLEAYRYCFVPSTQYWTDLPIKFVPPARVVTWINNKFLLKIVIFIDRRVILQHSEGVIQVRKSSHDVYLKNVLIISYTPYQGLFFIMIIFFLIDKYSFGALAIWRRLSCFQIDCYVLLVIFDVKPWAMEIS